MRVYQERRYGNAGREFDLVSFTLDNGTRVVFHAQESEDLPFVTASVIKPEGKK